MPAYAVPMGSAPVDVAPAEPRGGRRSITAPQDPSQVSQEEFDAMVRDLGIEEERQPASTGARAAAARPAAGARAPTAAAASRRRGAGGGPAQAGDEGGDGEPPKPKKPRNRKHGRPR